MILGEFNTDTSGYDTDNFDYLFKRKSKAERQQAKAIKNPKQAARRSARQIKKSGGVPPAKTRLIRGNFGLSNRIKTRIPVPTKTTPTPTTNSEPEVTDENIQDNTNTPEVQPDMSTNGGANTETAGNEAMPDSPDASENPEPASPESEYSYDESEKKEGTKPKTSGAGAVFGWAFLGVTVGVIVYILGAASKGPDKTIPEFKPR